MKTLVRFYLDTDGEVLAVFPQLNYNKAMYGNDMKTAYAHTGQHTAVAKSYYKSLKTASAAQFTDMHKELSNIGYNLFILK